MKHVAALAGVSLKTVSRVVNGAPTVSDDLIERVRAAAARLRYTPDLAARSLRRSDRRTAMIAMLVPDVSNPFFAELLRAVEGVARARGLSVIVASVEEDGQRERKLVTEFVARRVDGLIVVPAGTDHSYLAQAQSTGLPVICVDRPPVPLNADSVLLDNARGGRLGAEHLLAQGHTRIAYLGDHPSLYTSQQRFQGYREAMQSAGLGPSERLWRLAWGGYSFGRETALEMLDAAESPTAIFGGENLITMGVLRAIADRQLNGQVAVLGFDDFLLADLMSPPVSVIAQNVTDMGTRAAELLFARIDGDRSPHQHVFIQPSLIIRGS